MLYTPETRYGLDLGEYDQDSGHCDNCTHHDSQGYYIALVLPIDDFTGRTTTAKESMAKHFLTVAARSCDGFEHSGILTCW